MFRLNTYVKYLFRCGGYDFDTEAAESTLRINLLTVGVTVQTMSPV